MIRNDNKGVNMDYKELLSVGCLITKDLKGCVDILEII